MFHKLLYLLLAILPLSLVSVVTAGDLVTIKDSEAVDHIGEEVEVRGTVSEVVTYEKGVPEWDIIKGDAIITLGERYPRQSFNVAVRPETEFVYSGSLLRSLEGKEIGVRGKIWIYLATPTIVVQTRDQINIEWKTAREDPIDYLNGLVNDRYREELGLNIPLNRTELQMFKVYLNQNVKDWQDKSDEDLWKLVPKFRQKTLDVN